MPSFTIGKVNNNNIFSHYQLKRVDIPGSQAWVAGLKAIPVSHTHASLEVEGANVKSHVHFSSTHAECEIFTQAWDEVKLVPHSLPTTAKKMTTKHKKIIGKDAVVTCHSQLHKKAFNLTSKIIL